jgi:hypothetical protein
MPLTIARSVHPARASLYYKVFLYLQRMITLRDSRKHRERPVQSLVSAPEPETGARRAARHGWRVEDIAAEVGGRAVTKQARAISLPAGRRSTHAAST